MDRDKLRRACLAASVAVVWNAAAENAGAAIPVDHSKVYFQSSFLGSLSTLRFYGIGSGSGDPSLRVLFSVGLGSGAEPGLFTVPNGSDGQPIAFTNYAVFGKGFGSGGSGNDYDLSFIDPTPAIGRSFETVFPGFTEAQVGDAFDTNNDAALAPFLAKYVSLDSTDGSMGSPTTALQFSNGTPDGTFVASFSPVPEPGSAVICLGAMGFVGSLRRRV